MTFLYLYWKGCEILTEELFFQFGNKVFWQFIVIPMELDPSPVLANLFLYYHESKWMKKNNKDWHKKRKNICKYLYICWWFNSVQWCWWIWPSLNSVIYILQNQNLEIRMISTQKVHFYIWVLELKMTGFHKSLWQTKWFSFFPMLECLIYAALDIHSV